MQSKQMKKINKMKQNLRDLWDKTKRSNICVNRVPEGEEKKYEIEKLLEVIMDKMVPNLAKDEHRFKKPGEQNILKSMTRHNNQIVENTRHRKIPKEHLEKNN